MFYRIRTIKGRQYHYAEWRWRVGKKVKSKSKCLGPVGALLSNLLTPPSLGERAQDRAARDIERHGKFMAAIEEERSRNQAVFDEKMHAAYGMKPALSSPVPQEKTPATKDGSTVTPTSEPSAPPSAPAETTVGAASPR